MGVHALRRLFARQDGFLKLLVEVHAQIWSPVKPQSPSELAKLQSTFSQNTILSSNFIHTMRSNSSAFFLTLSSTVIPGWPATITLIWQSQFHPVVNLLGGVMSAWGNQQEEDEGREEWEEGEWNKEWEMAMHYWAYRVQFLGDKCESVFRDNLFPFASPAFSLPSLPSLQLSFPHEDSCISYSEGRLKIQS